MRKKRVFFKQKSILLGMAGLRIFIFIACLSLIGTRIFVGGRADDKVAMLFDVTKEGRIGQVEKLLLQGVNPDSLDAERNTPLFFNGLHAFFSSQYVAVMQLLLTFYANVNHQNIRGESVFQACVTITSGDILQQVFLILFSYGGDIDLKDKQGNTMLLVLTLVNSMNPIDALLGMFADVFGITRIEKAKEVALSYGYTDLAAIFDVYVKKLESNSFISPSNRGLNEFVVRIKKEVGDTYSFLTEERHRVFKARDKFGNTLLHFAAMTGNVQLVELILKNIPDLATIKNNAGSYPVHFLARSDVAIENRKKIAVLFKKYAISFNSIDGTGATLLLLLLRKKDVAFAKYILDEFGDLIKKNIRDNNGETSREFLERVDKELIPVLYPVGKK
jgi:ankyrin repeat protein